MASAVAAVSVVVTSVEGMVLAPVMLGQASEANAVAVFVALMFGDGSGADWAGESPCPS